MSLTTPTATFQRLSTLPPLSSHTLVAIGKHAYIFGGEQQPRQPVPNATTVLSLTAPHTTHTIPAQPCSPGGSVPVARVGHAAARIGRFMLVHGGRGGPGMSALDEGGIWAFDTIASTWALVTPLGGPSPPTRSYHAATGLEYPSASTATTSEAEAGAGPGYGTFVIHAGCLSDGGRTADAWAFDLASRTWAALPSAPGAGRGGSGFGALGTRLFRFGGFDGASELGGLETLPLRRAGVSDKGGQGEMPVAPAAEAWSAVQTKGETVRDRSVAGCVPLVSRSGRELVALFCGETSPSSVGHAGAGKFLGDMRLVGVGVRGLTGAAVVDAVSESVLGNESANGQVYAVSGEDGGEITALGGRGWFAADRADEIPGAFVVSGGLDEANERIGDAWLVTVS